MQANRDELDLEFYTKEGKPRKRKRKQLSHDYFTQDTENAILEYVQSTDPFERNKIFTERIYSAFDKLAECNINGGSYPYAQEHAGGYEDLKHETVYKLIHCMPKFNKVKGMEISKTRKVEDYTKGTLAYGYFNIIAKRFLIQYNEKQYKLTKNRKDLESEETIEKVDLIQHEDDDSRHFQDFIQDFANFIEEGLDDWFYLPDEDVDEYGQTIETETAIKLTAKERSIAKIIINMFRDVDNKDMIIWKPALYFQIKELTGQKTTDITRVVNILRHAFHEQMYEYNHRGELNIKNKRLF